MAGLDADRQRLVSALVRSYWLEWGGLHAAGALPLTMIAATVAAFMRTGRSARIVLGVTIVMLGADYAVWVLSPIDTAWLVATSFDRLLIQLWPAFVLAAFSAGGELPGLRVPTTGLDGVKATNM